MARILTRATFRRWPTLCGFSVQDDLSLAVYPWTGPAPSGRLPGEIAVALLDLIDERPEAREPLT